ncbi:hypothetical protein JD844_002412 [Phrynosoma platyrhinos]|uniref:Ig-like domain-containing protein n=1 Tax=Phrynosoma platyrhinos TaxID=52577 RepID=A0ABQ7TBD7_PHRPL|nr:hypothetical protein JD844_002412 [Phrynosoma platyrhinos]
MLQIYLIWLTLNLLKESSGQIVITQTPASVQVQPGDRVNIQCKASSSMSDDMALYQFIPGQNPKLLIHDGSSRFTGTPDRFSGSYSGTDFTFTINGVHPEDQASYYCGQEYTTPLHSDISQYKNHLISLIHGSYSGTDFTFTVNGVHPEDEGDYYCGQDYTTPLHSDTSQYKNHLNSLIHHFKGTPDHFSGSYSDTNFTFTISGVCPMDEGEYDCGQDNTSPLHSESSGQIVITQMPAFVEVQPGDRVNIQCKASSSTSDDMALYQFIPGQSPKLLVQESSIHFTRTPDRFNGSYSGTDFTFPINGVRPEDEGEYYCG